MLQVAQQKQNAASLAARILPIPVAVIVGVLFLYLSYCVNNKYTFASPRASGGIMTADTDETPLIFLVDGWELYEQLLLEPSALAENEYTPDCYTFIGEYSSFAFDDANASPYGEATYRMNIFVPAEPRVYTLEVPEIYSASKIWINGELMFVSGTAEAEEYDAKTGNSFLSFTASERIEIVVAASNYTHYYGGMIYPPAFGDADTVAALLTGRIIFTAALCFVSSLMSLLFVMRLFFPGDKRKAAIYGAFCFFYANAVSYPLMHSLRLDNMRFWYAFEDFFYFGCLFAVLLMLSAVCPAGKRVTRISLAVGAAMCALCVILPPLISGNAAFVYAYSHMITGYKLFLSAFVICACIASELRRQSVSKTAVAALAFFSCALATDAFVVLNEPLFWGRSAEWGGLVILAATAASGLRDAFAMYRSRREYEEQNINAMRLISMQKLQLDTVSEQIDSVRRAKHDLRHHLSVMEGLAGAGHKGELQKYLDGYRESLPLNDRILFCENAAVNAVICHYARLARESDIDADISIKLAADAGVSDHELCGIFGNLLENAVEACLRVTGDRFIRVRCDTRGDMLVLTAENTSPGGFRDTGGAALSSKCAGAGTGIASIRKLAQNYGGTTKFSDDNGVFSAFVALKVNEYKNK